MSGTPAPAALLEVEGLVKHFPIRGAFSFKPPQAVRAVDGLTFSVHNGETLALVGESGCGKSTTGRLLLRLIEPTAGRVRFDGTEITGLPPAPLRRLRPQMQIVFQDPFSSLNPRRTVESILAEPLKVATQMSHAERSKRIAWLLDRVGLASYHAARHPHEFSGGQRQRIGIARALALDPRFIVLDEAVSALDVSIQAQIVNLLQDLQRDLGLTYLFISHDLAVMRHIATRVAVMYLGQIVELAPKRELYDAPLHPYTQALIAAVPDPRRRGRRRRIEQTGEIPSPINPPAGCRFHTRCPHAVARCRHEEPSLLETSQGRFVACHLVTPTGSSSLTLPPTVVTGVEAG